MFQQLLPPPTWKGFVTTRAVVFDVVLKSLAVTGDWLRDMTASRKVALSWTFVIHTMVTSLPSFRLTWSLAQGERLSVAHVRKTPTVLHFFGDLESARGLQSVSDCEQSKDKQENPG